MLAQPTVRLPHCRDVLLRKGVILIEYLCNFGALRHDRTTVYALPLKLPDADGCPARIIAVEEH